ncbi:carbohydrate hydrolase [Deltaproteobacteria bacterium Smac51]|nr:carbohydrate hydrolase [Deltaproteobacteria bacterium Smac51]
MKISGYRRDNGYFGLRNHLLILPVSVCATVCAERIAALAPGSVAVHNQHGCSQIGLDLDITRRTLIGFGLNNNVGAALVIGLGCEGVQVGEVAEAIAASGKPVASLIIQENGGTLKTIARGAELAAAMMQKLSAQVRRECGLENIILGLECGGSDPTSGLASNPAIGYASTKMVDSGGSSILSETTEVIGAEHLLSERFADPEERARFLRMVSDVEKRAISMGVDLREGQPTPGNKEGGISTIEEKSLGCMYKAGHSPFQGALEYSQPLPIEKPGLYFMDSPGQDIDSITGMVASGANVIIFSTGRGTPTGSPIAPVIKITGNDATYQKMPDNIDLNAGTIFSQGQKLEVLGEELFSLIIQVANGNLTKAECLGHHEFGIYRLTGAF